MALAFSYLTLLRGKPELLTGLPSHLSTLPYRISRTSETMLSPNRPLRELPLKGCGNLELALLEPRQRSF